MTTVACTTAIATYGYTKALKEGLVPSPRLTLEHIEVSPITDPRGLARESYAVLTAGDETLARLEP